LTHYSDFTACENQEINGSAMLPSLSLLPLADLSLVLGQVTTAMED
jgi:hypothetical protein